LFLGSALPNIKAKSQDVSLLRQTLKSPFDLEGFEAFVQPLADKAKFDVQHHLAWACRELGLVDRATEIAKTRILSKLDAEALLKNVAGRMQAQSPSASWVKDGSLALSQLKEELDKLGVEFFLVSGTFLGCEREGSLLGHDKDIDVGVMQGVDI